MRIPTGTQCDVCNAITRNDKEFFDFILPPSLSPMTGRPDGRFPGVASASNPKMLAELKACPRCVRKLMQTIEFATTQMKTALGTTVKALQIAAIGDLRKLPPGRLRKSLEQIKAKYGGQIGHA